MRRRRFKVRRRGRVGRVRRFRGGFRRRRSFGRRGGARKMRIGRRF